MKFSTFVLVFLVSLTVHGSDEWPQFRGPGGEGHTDARGLALRWSESQNVGWKTPIPGSGHSSPVVSGNQIWLTTAIAANLTPEEEKRKLAQIKNPNGLEIAASISLRAICIDGDSGKLLKQIELFAIDDPGPKHSLNSYASPSPIVEQGRLFCHFGTFGTACVDVESGKIVWKNQSLKIDHQNGPGSSPVLWRNLLITNFDGIDRQFVAAIDKRDGRVAWKTKRSGKMNERVEFQKAYCTPIVVEDGGRAQVISPGADWVYSYDPASGRELWRAAYGGLGFSTVPRPVVGHGLVYVCTSYLQSKLVAVRYNGSGDVTKSHIAWKFDKQVPKKPSTILVGHELYFVSDGGIVTCLDARSGDLHWRERLSGQYSASPLYAEGRIYFFSQDGKATVIKPGKQFQQIAINELDDGFMASPAVMGSAMVLRTTTHLYRVEDKSAAGK